MSLAKAQKWLRPAFALKAIQLRQGKGGALRCGGISPTANSILAKVLARVLTIAKPAFHCERACDQALGRAPTAQVTDVAMTASSVIMAVTGLCAVPKLERIQEMADRLPTYYGIIKNFHHDRGLGFIECDETKDVYEKDILVLRSQLGEQVATLSLSLACPLITIISYVAPTPTVLDAVRLMKASNLNVIVFKLQAACNVLSIAYGLQIANAAVLMTNMFGLACQVLFLAGERYASLESEWLSFALYLSVVLNSGIFVSSRCVPINLLGQSITVFNVFLYSSPLMNLGIALRTRNSSQFPTFLVVVNVFNNALWSIYALLIEVRMPKLVRTMIGSFLAGYGGPHSKPDGLCLLLFPGTFACGHCCQSTVVCGQVLLILWCRNCLPFDLSFLVTFAQRKKPDDFSLDMPETSPEEVTDGDGAWL
eukprot:g11984.t1